MKQNYCINLAFKLFLKTYYDLLPHLFMRHQCNVNLQKLNDYIYNPFTFYLN